MAVQIKNFGQFENDDVFCVELMNAHKTKAELITFGASWHSFEILDRHGNFIDTIVGPKTLDGYIKQFKGVPYFFGNTIGRHAGRIQCDHPSMHSRPFKLSDDNGIQLHGGNGGFSKKNWSIKETKNDSEPSVTFSYESKDGEEGYPGDLCIEVTYALLKDNTVTIHYKASTTKQTPVNLTNHSYFNLDGGSVLNNSLFVDSDKKLELNADLLPTGKLQDVKGTTFNFNDYSKLNKIVSTDGLDDVFMFNDSENDAIKIRISSEDSGLQMAVRTDQPAVVIFAPKGLDFSESPKSLNIDYAAYPAICFETQLPPDSLNHSNFPSCLLDKEKVYTQRTSFHFSYLEN